MLWTHDGYLVCLEGYTIHHSWPSEDDIEGIKPLVTVRKADCMDGLMPDCDSRFEVRRPSTILGALLELSLLATFLVVVALIVVILHHILVLYMTKP